MDYYYKSPQGMDELCGLLIQKKEDIVRLE